MFGDGEKLRVEFDSSHPDFHLRNCGEMFAVDALKRRPSNVFGLEPETFEVTRAVLSDLLTRTTDPQQTLIDFGFIVRPEFTQDRKAPWQRNTL